MKFQQKRSRKSPRNFETKLTHSGSNFTIFTDREKFWTRAPLQGWQTSGNGPYKKSWGLIQIRNLWNNVNTDRVTDPHYYAKLDPDPHYYEKLDPDPHWKEKLDPVPYQDLNWSQNSGVLEDQNGAVKGRERS